MMNERTEDDVIREPLHKTRTLWKMAEVGFASVFSVEEFISARKQKYRLKIWTRCKIAWIFLKSRGEDRKVEDISAVELNEYIKPINHLPPH